MRVVGVFWPGRLGGGIGFGFGGVLFCLFCAEAEEFEGEEHWDGWILLGFGLRGVYGAGLWLPCLYVVFVESWKD